MVRFGMRRNPLRSSGIEGLTRWTITIPTRPTTSNPLGAKGCGEAGTSGGLAAVANAVIDALSEYGIRHLEMPMTPSRIWQAIQDAKKSA